MSEEARPSDSGPEPAPVVPARTNEGWQPGDPTPRAFVERVIRVDQAGEFGAVRIYEGQLAALRWRGQGNSPAARKIEHMLAQEVEHRRAFDALLADRRVRPTALSPVWSVAGFALGAATALLGDAAAMACTVAVEEAIDEHYASQRDRLGDDEAPLRDTVERFRQEEVAHRDEALANGAEEAPAYDLLTAAIKGGSRLAIWLSTRV
ncbi:demethoxyubiquinone hydroxylase family protein [Vineibacter terrae]|uniref:demethoxyubiquinone hydroxylase family protein n=1 Tax=Vineibacter terrae TaxID=2586908 RepID=UPI002E32A81C|nr:demethoxyubiquinone hydroxylase family protein [Vineibacter terrae]HEX2887274.1 demethoxyubiquinone hydroxylase family protein [Vineibacter terrae]